MVAIGTLNHKTANQPILDLHFLIFVCYSDQNSFKIVNKHHYTDWELSLNSFSTVSGNSPPPTSQLSKSCAFPLWKSAINAWWSNFPRNTFVKGGVKCNIQGAVSGNRFVGLIWCYDNTSDFNCPTPSKGFKIAENISMGKCNTILSAYTKYRHLG